MENSRVKNTARNILASTVFRVINLSFPFIINTIIINTLGVEYLGLNMLFASILQVLNLTELGFGTALTFSMYEPIAKNDTMKVSALLAFYRKAYLIIGTIILSVGLLCIPFLSFFIEGEVPEGISIYILFVISLVNSVISYFLFAYRSALLIANQRQDIVDKINIFIEITMNISKILVLLVTEDYYLFCVLQPIYTVINCILVWRISKKRYPQYKCEGIIPKSEKKLIFSRVIGVSINKLCFVLSNSFDSVIISSFMGLAILGQYNNYFVIANAVMFFMQIISRSAISSIGNSIVCEPVEKNYEDFCSFQFVFNMIMGWAAICIICLNQPFVNFWLGNELMFDDVTAGCFAFYMYAITSSEIFMAYREAAGIWEHDRVRPFVEGILNLILNIVLVQIMGIIGVMLSTIFTMGIIRMIWGSYYLFKEYFIGYSHARYLLKMLHYGIFTAIAGTISFVVCGLIEIDGVFGFFVKMMVCTIIPGMIYLLIYFRSKELRSSYVFFKTIINRKTIGRR